MTELTQQSALTQQNTQDIEYLVIGHLTADITPEGTQLGGTAAFSGLTAHSLGLKTALISSFGQDCDPSPLSSLQVMNKVSNTTTTFKNISDGIHRTQFLYDRARNISTDDIPSAMRNIRVLHLGPVADEVDPAILELFPDSLKCLTPQGWLRGVDSAQQVISKDWENWDRTLALANAAVISVDDVAEDEETIHAMASTIPVFAVTEHRRGARVYWHHDVRFFSAPEVKYVDDTGAGDIFAAAFFCRYLKTQNPWEAGRFAVLLASQSVTRKRLNSIPKPDEIRNALIEIIEK